MGSCWSANLFGCVKAAEDLHGNTFSHYSLTSEVSRLDLFFSRPPEVLVSAENNDDAKMEEDDFEQCCQGKDAGYLRDQ